MKCIKICSIIAASPWYLPKLTENTEARTYWGR